MFKRGKTPRKSLERENSVEVVSTALGGPVLPSSSKRVPFGDWSPQPSRVSRDMPSSSTLPVNARSYVPSRPPPSPLHSMPSALQLLKEVKLSNKQKADKRTRKRSHQENKTLSSPNTPSSPTPQVVLSQPTPEECPPPTSPPREMVDLDQSQYHTPPSTPPKKQRTNAYYSQPMSLPPTPKKTPVHRRERRVSMGTCSPQFHQYHSLDRDVHMLAIHDDTEGPDSHRLSQNLFHSPSRPHLSQNPSPLRHEVHFNDNSTLPVKRVGDIGTAPNNNTSFGSTESYESADPFFEIKSPLRRDGDDRDDCAPIIDDSPFPSQNFFALAKCPNCNHNLGEMRVPKPFTHNQHKSINPFSPNCSLDHDDPDDRSFLDLLDLDTSYVSFSRYREDFEEHEELGSGSFGTVFKCTKKLDGWTYAVKQSRQKMNKSDLFEVFALAAAGDNPHIVRYYNSWIESGYLFIQTEFCAGGSLADLLLERTLTAPNRPTHEQAHAHDQDIGSPLCGVCGVDSPLFPEEELRDIIKQVALGLKDFHSRNLVHLDIKPDNIYRTSSGVYKIGDLGLATSSNCHNLRDEGDSRYLSREILDDDYHNLPKADMFALGVTVYELCGNTPLPSQGAEWAALREGKVDLPSVFSPQFSQLVKALMSPDPLARPSAEEVIRHSSLIDGYCDDAYLLRKERQRVTELELELSAARRQLASAGLSLQSTCAVGSSKQLSDVDLNPMGRVRGITPGLNISNTSDFVPST